MSYSIQCCHDLCDTKSLCCNTKPAAVQSFLHKQQRSTVKSWTRVNFISREMNSVQFYISEQSPSSDNSNHNDEWNNYFHHINSIVWNNIWPLIDKLAKSEGVRDNHCYFEAETRRAKHVFSRNPTVFENQLTSRRGPDSQLVLLLSKAKTFCRFWYDESADTLVSTSK